MPRIDPSLIPVLIDLDRGLRALGIRFGIIGALVPELLLDVRPRRMTNDADAAVLVESFAAFDALKDGLSEYGFTRTAVLHRMQHRSGGRLDLLPFSETIAPGRRLQLEPDVVINMAGFDRAVDHSVPTVIEGGPTLPLVPLPLYVLLKLVAFSDRHAGKDLGSVLHCLEHYREADDLRYEVEHDGAGVPFEYTCAYLLGLDGRHFLDEPLAETVKPVLGLFSEPEAPIVGAVAREQGRVLMEDDERLEIVDRFHWYRLGAGL
jgi:predicted nucleotidyltransferase